MYTNHYIVVHNVVKLLMSFEDVTVLVKAGWFP